ncbi:hypothetical protein SZ47_06310 [Brachyspira hyodysenteriae]|uniref:DUF1963 domain-containing protein n=2 Tax=Brachyspira hyodysenteriae TaxID=159 RepID=A0A3B6VY22_BRAHO|nr:hypothetical protein BHYOB78_07850 [Brachyspira hyodysenteriae ATCC 27164]KLI19114.1 hypothetical protein SU44_01235 [Brachyspira hyodysenteriae]KLI26407.1 hypothetical protein SZ47_06310 [Brachyspira hyodysenteriae]KLI53563.1 hypothetical protein SZ42_01285 [Brachyspira hyodysenteriae]TVL44289.1 hypothetical protein A9X73_00955 [Brachyspira hyodysenteriae]
MMLEHKCDKCGTELGYKGLCFKCKAEEERNKTLALTDDEIKDIVSKYVKNLKEKDIDKELIDGIYIYDLIAYRNIDLKDIAKKALEKKIYYPEVFYYKASEEIRDELIKRIRATKDYSEGANLLSCLAMQGDDAALDCLYDFEMNPREWRNKLYVDPSVYAECAGWTFDKDKKRQILNFDKCYYLDKAQSKEEKEQSPIIIASLRNDNCPECGCRNMDMAIIDGRDERLKFIGVNGIIKASCCPNCVIYNTTYSKYDLKGGSKILPFDKESENYYPPEENYIEEEELNSMHNNNYILSKNEVPLFYGAFDDTLNTIGGFANWVQDWEYMKCPSCGKKMKYLMQIHWHTIESMAEGTLFIEICTDCNITAMFHQQT